MQYYYFVNAACRSPKDFGSNIALTPRPAADSRQTRLKKWELFQIPLPGQDG